MAAVGILSALRLSRAVTEPPTEPPTPRFAIDEDSIDPAVFGLTSYASPITRMPRIDRATAIQVPALKRARDLICSPIGALPLATYNAQRGVVRTDLLEQPEAGVPRMVTMTRLVEDLLFEEVAVWRVTEFTPTGFPKRIRRLDPRKDVDIDDDKGEIRDRRTGQRIPDREIIRFYSPTDGLLTAGARALRTLLMLDARAYRSAENPVPDGFFRPRDDVDPFDDEPDDDATEDEKAAAYTAAKFITEWNQARQNGGSQGYVPAALEYEKLAWDPKALQLTEARQHAVIEIARIAGVDPEDLGVSTTSRTYFNAETKRRDRLDFTLNQYVRAIEDRLSMGDVTPRGQYVRFNIDGFLRTDTLARYDAYEKARALGLLTLNEMRALEDLPPLDEPETPEQEVNNVTELPVRAHRFAADNGVLTFDTPAGHQEFSVDLEKRTIRGMILPYGSVGYSRGVPYQFGKGTIRTPVDSSRVKLYIEHDRLRAVGHAVEFSDTDTGLFGVFKVANTPDGDHALLMASEKVWDGFSVGLGRNAKFRAGRDGVHLALEAPMVETSLTAAPAFDDARVSTVALSADDEGKPTMTETPVKPAETTEDTTAPVVLGEEFGKQFSADLAAQLGPEMAKLFQQVAERQTPPTREDVAATASAQFSVREELPYRFDGSSKGERCFTDDLREAWNGNAEAKTRLEAFMEDVHQAFAVTTGNTSALNPTQNRPELYVPQLLYTRPLWDLVSTGTLNDKTPFTVPKFGTATGLAGDHTEGVEPTPGTFTATVQTISPSAISGKVEINREVWDQGGNPQTDTIVWREMQNAYFEAIESKIAAMLNAIAAANLYGGAEQNLAGAVDGALSESLMNLLVDLQFVRGGNRYTAAAADGVLYKALAGAQDTTGRALFPLLGPTNASGTIEPVASSINVHGQTFRPAWALNTGVANARHSYMFVPGSVWQWASAPKRFTFEYQVKSIDMAVWGYTGGAVLKESDVIRIDHTTADV
jgi:HK97 family phage prohead protease